MKRAIPTALFVLIAAQWACGGGAGTVEPDAGQDLRETHEEADLPVILPDSRELEDGLSDGHTELDSGLEEVAPEVIWEPEPCQSHADCEDGFCVEVVAGSGQFLCAPTCIEECPGDWLCKAIHLDGPDLVSICLPGDGCLGAPEGAPCNGPDPCLDYVCEAGFCVGTPVQLDVIPDGIDEDCDGQIDEDVYLGFRFLGGTFGAGSGIQSGGGWTLAGTAALSGYVGTSSSVEMTVIPGTP